MRVALISFGFFEYCVPLANGLQHGQDADVLLFLPQPEAQSHLHALNPAVQFVGFHKPRLRQAIAQVRLMLNIVRQIWQFKADVVHIQGSHVWVNLLVLPLLRKYPLVVSIHDPRPHLGDAANTEPKWLKDLGYRAAHQIIVHSQAMQPVAAKEFGFAPQQVHVVPLTLNIEIENPAHADSAPETEHIPDVLFYGRIWEYKGLDYLIKAEPLITAQVPNVRITIAGRGENIERYFAMMTNRERFDVHNRFISEEDRQKLFARTDVVVQPYLEATQSGVTPHAYAASKPVVATRVGGLPDMVEHGQTGLLVAPKDVPALAEALISILKDAQCAAQMGRNGRRKLEAECAPDVVAAQTVRVYARAIQQHKKQKGELQ